MRINPVSFVIVLLLAAFLTVLMLCQKKEAPESQSAKLARSLANTLVLHDEDSSIFDRDTVLSTPDEKLINSVRAKNNPQTEAKKDSSEFERIQAALAVEARKEAKTFNVKRLPRGKTISLADSSLKDWDDSYLIFSVSALDAKKKQWKKIRDRKPDKLSANDIDLKVYMAIDDSNWYIAARVTDDILISPLCHLPYSGDCLEIFFAGRDDNSMSDIHSIIDRYQSEELNSEPGSVPDDIFDNSAFFQLELPAAKGRYCDYFPDYRNDVLGRRLQKGDRPSPVCINLKKNGFTAEACLPLRFFQKKVREKIQLHQPLRLGLDYLDYDKPVYDGSDIFWPDNVFCPHQSEKHVNIPMHMDMIIFQ